MSKQRRSAYGAPQEQKEVEITLDRRVAMGGGLILLLVVALGLGYWFAQRSSGAATTAAPVPVTAGTPVPPGVVAIEGEMKELGLPPGAVVITPNVIHSDGPFVQGTPAVPAVQPTLAVAATGPTPAVPAEYPIPGGEPVDLPPERAAWPPEVMAVYPDANLSEDVVPLRAEKVQSPESGPRIAISDLNDFYTYNFGVIPLEKVAEHDFQLSNAGDADLIVSRIYTSCGCTATVFGGDKIKGDGFLPAPVTLKPGESRPFTIQFDPRAEGGGKPVTQMKYIQIYSNDPTRFVFDDNDPLAREVRFRIVMKPEQGVQ